MTVYILTLIFIIILPLIINVLGIKNSGRKVYTLLIGAWMFLLLILRNETVGNDLVNYIPRYILFGRSSWEQLLVVAKMKETEIGYAALNKLLFYLSQSPYTIISFSACIIVCAYCYRIYKDSDLPQLSFVLFVGLGLYTNAFSALRQATATALCLIAYRYLRERNLTKFAIVIVLASLLHKSALIMFLLYPIINLKVNIKIVFGFLISAILCIVVGPNLITFITNNLAYERYSFQIGRGDGAVGVLLIYLIFLVVLFLMQKDYDSIEMRINIYSLLILVLFSILTFVLPIIARIMTYFNAMLVIGMPHVVANIKAKHNRMILLFLMYFLLIGYYLFVICRNDTSGIIPYEFRWSDKVW